VTTSDIQLHISGIEAFTLTPPLQPLVAPLATDLLWFVENYKGTEYQYSGVFTDDGQITGV
jgi:hypothetical protein